MEQLFMEQFLLHFKWLLKNMKSSRFDSLAKTIDEMPARQIIKAIELERMMINEDLSNQRISAAGETRSILNFCRFVAAAKWRQRAAPTTVPASHIGFYRRTVQKLVNAGELPVEAEEQFERAFSVVFGSSPGNARTSPEPQTV
ncbi:MAG: hypothetical protein KGJ60_09355 [Verrucomicrobiota bacterium]|nr:hypothetical protein [Verrucomicrobiota bacterium]